MNQSNALKKDRLIIIILACMPMYENFKVFVFNWYSFCRYINASFIHSFINDVLERREKKMNFV